MSEREDAIIAELVRSAGWVDSRSLATALGVTTRTIRNRIRRINEAAGEVVIESSYRGYRLAEPAPSPTSSPKTLRTGTGLDLTPRERGDALLRMLLQSEGGVSVYDLADRYCVSDSTIEADLRTIRSSIAPFDLTLERSRDKVRLAGTERNLRRLMGQLVSQEQPEQFSAQTNTNLESMGFDTKAMARVISSRLEECGFSPDDFGINNILVHLAVMARRLERGNVASPPTDEAVASDSPAYRAARDICADLARKRGIEVPDAEVDYLALVVASNGGANAAGDPLLENLPGVVGDSTMELTRRATRALEHAYHLPAFDEDFVTRVSVHIHGLILRGTHGIALHNPLTEQIKRTYPLVYDMAVYLAEQLAETLGLEVSEDEIALLAFHIGASLERTSASRSLVACDFLYLDYHGMYHAALKRIEEEFRYRLRIAQVCRASEYDPSASTSDLVLTPAPIRGLDASRQVIVHPLLTDDDLRRISRAVDEVRGRRQSASTLEVIQRFLSPELFHNEYYRSSSQEMIRSLAAECSRAGYCDEDFADQALLRERLSPTEYHNKVAMPHTLSAPAHHSFLATVINRRPMRWHHEDVNVIMLMGIAEDDRAAFRELFDGLLEVLSEPANVNRLIRTSGYDEFAQALCSMLQADR